MRIEAAILSYTVIGAIIGYVTNAIAIKMLFHPKKPIKLGPIVIQGVIPAKSRELAERVAKLLSSELVDEILYLALKDALSKGAVREAIMETIDHKIRRTLSEVHPILLNIIDTRSIANGIASVIEQIVAGSTDDIARMAAKIVKRMELEKHVTRALEELKPDEAEKLFKMLASRELRFIELSGAILGALIGFMNALVALLFV